MAIAVPATGYGSSVLSSTIMTMFRGLEHLYYEDLETWSCSARRRQLQGEFTVAFQIIKGVYKKQSKTF